MCFGNTIYPEKLADWWMSEHTAKLRVNFVMQICAYGHK